MSKKWLEWVVAAGIVVSGAAACSGGPDVDDSFAVLMQRPDIDEAARQYQQLQQELVQALSAAIPALAGWQPATDGGRSSCGSEYPGVGFDGVILHLADVGVPGKLADADYERALTIIGTTAQKYGFDPRPQRVHDEPGSHDAFFHNVHDDGAISFGTAKNTSLGLDLGCHLTAEAKRRGSPSKG